jgi:hypothetical protein
MTNTTARRMGLGFKIVFLGLVLIAGVVNLQPWLGMGAAIAAKVTVIPFQLTLQKLPFVGACFAMVFGAIGSLIGGCFWAAIQLAQISPLLADNEAFISEYGQVGLNAMAQLSKARAVAYVVEVCALWLYYPPYGNGLQDFWMDFFHWDVYLFDWENLGIIVVTLLAFEGAILMLMKVWMMLEGASKRQYLAAYESEDDARRPYLDAYESEDDAG